MYIYTRKYRYIFTLLLLISAVCVNIKYSVIFSSGCDSSRDDLAGLDSHTHSHSSGTSKSRGSGRSLGTLKQKIIILWVLPCDLCPMFSTLMWYSQPLLCLPAFRGVRQGREHQGHPELQGRPRGRCYLVLPTDEYQVMIRCDDCLCILAVDSDLYLLL